jgi:HEAT repeat protein
MDLRAESLRLRDLASLPPTTETRNDVMLALASKFEGIQAVAAEVLGTWGDGVSKDALRQWFMETLERPLGWAIRSVGIRELARLATAEDAGWVLDLYFGATDGLLQHELTTLAAALPPVPAKELVIAKARDQNARVRHSALKVLARGSWGSPRELLRPFARDQDPLIRKMLRAWGAA